MTYHLEMARAAQEAANEARWERGDYASADRHDKAVIWYGKEYQKYLYRLAAHSYRLSVEMAANPLSASRLEESRRWHEDNAR